MFIENGAGDGGFIAKVSKGLQLLTQSENHPLVFHQSMNHGLTFTMAQLAAQTVTASAEEILCTIANTDPARWLCINHIHVAAYDGHGLARVYVGSVSGADGTAYTPGNHNRKSGNVALATVYVSDGTLTVTGGTQVCTKGISPEHPTAEITFNGSVILGLNDTLDVRFFEQAGATPDASLCVEGFYYDK